MNARHPIMVRALGLTKRYVSGRCEKTALHHINLTIPSGQFWIVSGPSGSGKTTLLGLLAGMMAPTKGEVHLDGHLRSPQGAGCRDPWVTEYYSQKRTPAADVFFVSGSDITGPMGKALVPVAGRTAAEQFRKDHRGNRILTAADLTIEVLQEIAGKPSSPHSP